MKYRRADAKSFAHEKLTGIWAAATQPFEPDSLALDEAGFRNNLRHWADDLNIDGFFVGGKQGEFFSMSVEERKAAFDWSVDELGQVGTILSCSDQNMDTVIDLAKHAEAIGADFIVVHAPVLSFFKAQAQTVYEYYRYIAEQVNIGIAMWSHPDSGYLMSPELCARIAKLPNIVAIKYSVPRDMYSKLTRMVGNDLIVSTASEVEWLDNVLELDWKCYLCSNPPYLLQTARDKRMKEYTDLAFAGDEAGARQVWESLQPIRRALAETRPAEKPQAHSKYWQELLGQVGGPVRRPLLDLTEEEKLKTLRAFQDCGLSGVEQDRVGRSV